MEKQGINFIQDGYTTPVPTPVLVIVPVPPTRTAEYCSILDIQFEINQDEIQLEEKKRCGKPSLSTTRGSSGTD